MAPTTRRETITMPDGGSMGAFVAVRESGSGPGMLVLMEVFGVGVYIREAAERLAGLGYVALAPDLYRRNRPGAEFAHDAESLADAVAAAQEGAWLCADASGLPVTQRWQPECAFWAADWRPPWRSRLIRPISGSSRSLAPQSLP